MVLDLQEGMLARAREKVQKAGLEGVLPVTKVIFDPHFQRRETILRLAQAAGFKV